METVGFLSDTSEEVVVAKLPHPEKVFVRKGRFPETFNIVDGNFCFVNIDTDLYAPTKAGLELFYPLMNRGGVILIHDYFSPCLAGVAAAVDEFIQHIDIPVIPIGDDLSIAILKP